MPEALAAHNKRDNKTESSETFDDDDSKNIAAETPQRNDLTTCGRVPARTISETEAVWQNILKLETKLLSAWNG